MKPAPLSPRHVFEERVSPRVVLASDRATGQALAVKLARDGSETSAAELAREWELLASLDHPSFPKAVEWGSLEGGPVWFSMERAVGDRPCGPMTAADLAALVAGCGGALATLHARGFAHCDLTPDHVRIDAATGRVTLLDLEHALRLTDDDRVKWASRDLRALGVLLYEACAGRAAADRDSGESARQPLHASRPDLPKAFCCLVDEIMTVRVSVNDATANETCAHLLESLQKPRGLSRSTDTVSLDTTTASERLVEALARLGGAAKPDAVGGAARLGSLDMAVAVRDLIGRGELTIADGALALVTKRAAVVASNPPSLRARTVVGEPIVTLRDGNAAAAATALRAQLSRLASGASVERAALLVDLGHALAAGAEQAEALASGEAALQMATEAGDRDLDARASIVLGHVYAAFGSSRDGVSWQRRAMGAATRPATRALAQAELGWLLVREGHLDAAARTLKQAMDEAASGGTDVQARSVGGLASARLGHVLGACGDPTAAETLLRTALAVARELPDAPLEVEAGRLLGALLSTFGRGAEGLALMQAALTSAIACGLSKEMPALHAGIATNHLRSALRLITPTGTVADRRGIELARVHAEKGLDLTVATGRMADRALLEVVGAQAALLAGEGALALEIANRAHGLAMETGDLIVASRARLVRAEGLLAAREFGEAMAEARIACEALERSGATDEAWRAHASLARCCAAWGMGAREAAETALVREQLDRIEACVTRSNIASFRADVEREQARHGQFAASTRSRRSHVVEMTGERFSGCADGEDLIEALLSERQSARSLRRRLNAIRMATMASRQRRVMLARAERACAKGGAADFSRLVAAVAMACGGRAVLARVGPGGVELVAGAGASSPGGESLDRELVRVAREALADRVRIEGRDEARNRIVVMPIGVGRVAVGALVVLPDQGRTLTRASVQALRLVASMLCGPLAAAAQVDRGARAMSR